MNAQNKFSEEELLAKLMRYCAYRERCVKEVEDKLKALEATSDQLENILQKLISDDFVNEERFAIIFVTDKFRLKNWGKIRIQRELRLRKIPEELIFKALREIPQEAYFKTFENLFDKKAKTLKDPNLLKRKKKLLNFMLYRGFEYALIMEKLHGYQL